MTRHDLDDLLAAAEAAVSGAPDVRDHGLPESALARPRTRVFGAVADASLHHRAAALPHSLVRNHALVDGDERLGRVAVRPFDVVNGRDPRADEDDGFAFVMSVADGFLPEVDTMADWLARRVVGEDL